MICPRCGTENADAARFCNGCGAPLADVATAPNEERKTVSVLFCDLVGFTAASEAADPEDVRARLRPYHATLRYELERYGGTVEKFIGDAVMAVFGAPVAHEDDPERAVRAGLRIIEAIRELNEREPGLELQVRVGINTGPAVVALQARPEHGEGIVAGDVVNTAARIQAAAPVMAVAVSEETFRQTERVVAYEPLAPAAMKGKSAAVLLYRAVEARARFGTDLTRTEQTLFVGREVEKTLLQGLFDRCARDSTVAVVTLVGEPGVGKSRLTAELFRYVDERPELIRWRQGRCLPYGEGITFWALGELVKSHAGVFDSDSPDTAAAKLDEVIPAIEERDWVKARTLPLLGIDSGQSESREESFAAWRRFVESIAADGPAIVVIEDLHWADPPLLDFLSYFAEWAEGVPLLLLCTARPELFERHDSWGARTRNAHTINLSPLSDQETSVLVQGLLEQSVSEQVRQTILERAGGNPLYAEEFVRLVADRGLGDTDEGIAFPDSVQALIAARLDTLSPERKALLQDAAVVGKVFWVGALAAMGDVDEREVERALHELSRRELVRPARRSTMEGENEYAFWHVIVRDVAYAQIPRAARARKHRAAAAWLEAKAEQRVEDVADVLAYHYQEALELATAADDPVAADLLPAARRMLELAGDRAESLDLPTADSFYRRAIVLHDPDSATLAPLLLKAGRTAVGFDLARAEEDARRAVDLLERAGDELGTAEALLDLSRYAAYRGSEVEHLEYAERARELVERHAPGPVYAVYLTRKAGDDMLAGRASECVETSNAAIAMAGEFGLDDLAARSLQYRGVARTELGDAGGLDDLREAVERLSGSTAIAHGIGLLNLADATWMVVGPEEGLELHGSVQAFCESRGLRGSMWWSKAESTWMLFDLGRWDDVLATIDAVAAAGEATAGLQAIELGLSYQALVFLRRGDTERAASIVEDLLPKARAAGDMQLLVPALAASAVVAAASDDPDSAVGFVRELADGTRGRSDRYRALFLPELTRVCAAAGALDLAHELGDSLSVDLGRVGIGRAAAAAVLAEAEGRLAEAVALYEEAARRWRDYGCVPGLADALLGQSRCLVAARRPGAEQPLADARELFTTMGDVVGLAACSLALASSGEKV
ncbi:MAG: adenylate/guanylate cyclase domain-containing protein [Gaiellaceae bacterium]